MVKLGRFIITLIFVISSIFLIIKKTYWILAFLLIIVSIIQIFSSNQNIKTWAKQHPFASNSFFILTICILAISIRLTTIELYSITSGSMENTLVSGDIILISKLSYGPRLPSSPFEIPYINLFFYINRNSRKNIDTVWWEHKRLTGFVGLKHNDVVVFNSPDNLDDILVKRCMGLPGDTILIKNDQVFSNGTQITQKSTIKILYRIVFNNFAKASSIMDSLNGTKYHFYYDQKNYSTFSLTSKEVIALKKYNCVDSIYVEKDQLNTSISIFPFNPLFPWTKDDYGPIIIPSKGMTIQMNESNYILYNYTINHFEGSRISEINDRYFINGIETSNYIFKNNYYFMLGDNRNFSIDSRYKGFIPDQNIIGKAILVLFSKDQDRTRWGRFFKVII